MTVIDSFSGDYRFLSNFWYSPVPDGEIVWPTVEHGYQFFKLVNAEKLATKEYLDSLNLSRFRSSKRPYLNCRPWEIKSWGQEIELRSDWEQVKIPLMARLVKAKFLDLEMRQLLLDTDDAELIEGNTWNDTFWGVCNGKGHNHLGKILVAERHEIRMFA